MTDCFEKTVPSTSPLEELCSLEDIFHRHLLPFLSQREVGHLEASSRTLKQVFQGHGGMAWKILVERDFDLATAHTAHTASTAEDRLAPRLVSNQWQTSTMALRPHETWKLTYKSWAIWQDLTAGAAEAQHFVQADRIWNRLLHVLESLEMHHVLQSLQGHPPLRTLRSLGRSQMFPSSLLALYSICGGQALLQPRSPDHDFFAGLMGSYACYDQYYSMRLFNVDVMGGTALASRASDDIWVSIGISPGQPLMFLYVHVTPDDPQGEIVMVHSYPVSQNNIHDLHHPVVGRGGVLSYLETYVQRLESGFYKSTLIVPEAPTSRGIGLFPDANLPRSEVLESSRTSNSSNSNSHDGLPMMSCCTTRGIQVRASCRWFPGGTVDQQDDGLNFGYCIRIQMVPSNDGKTHQESTYQLVGRHWEFMDGNGRIRRVDGDGVIGKQPKLFLDSNGNPGYEDLGPAGEGDRRTNSVFIYQSQSGPVQGTSVSDTKAACVSGTFSFMPGSIANPTGPIFHVVVGKFPLAVTFPFY